MTFRLATVIIILLLFAISPAGAQNKYTQKQFSIELGPEYRNHDFRWSIAGNEQGTSPNIFSELIFNPVKATGFYLNGVYRSSKKISLQAIYNKLYSFRGNATDIDYADDNRTSPTRAFSLRSDKGGMRTIAANINYPFIENDIFSTKAGIGYASTKEIYHLFDDNNAAVNSTYNANWQGPRASIDATWFVDDLSSFGAGLAYSYVWYNAHADWNAINTFKHPISFRQNAKGNAWDYYFKLGWAITDHVIINLTGSFSNWQTQAGKDNLYLNSGDTLKTRMNGAFKKSTGVRLTTTIKF